MPLNPFAELTVRIVQLEARMSAIESLMSEITMQITQLQAAQLHWTPQYRFQQPPLNT